MRHRNGDELLGLSRQGAILEGPVTAKLCKMAIWL
jgi:hypothetical protein